MKLTFFELLSALIIVSIIYGIVAFSSHYDKWGLRGDEIMYDSSNYQLKVK